MRWAEFAEHLHDRYSQHRHGHHEHCVRVEVHDRGEDDAHRGFGFDFGPGPFGGGGRVRRELWGLFEDWLDSLGDEIVAFAREQGSVKGADVAAKFNISEKSARHLLRRLRREGRLRSRGLEAVEAESGTEPVAD